MVILVGLAFIAIFAVLLFLSLAVLPYQNGLILSYLAVVISAAGLAGSVLGLWRALGERRKP